MTEIPQIKQLYVIRAEESQRVKIGVSKDPAKRLKQLQTGSEQKLILEYTECRADAHKIEKWLHSHFTNFDKKHYRGEWFNPIEIGTIRSRILGYMITDADYG